MVPNKKKKTEFLAKEIRFFLNGANQIPQMSLHFCPDKSV